VLDMFRQTFGIDPKAKMRAYQKPYPKSYEYIQFPQGFNVTYHVSNLHDYVDHVFKRP
jgi:hypothetical protein